MTSAITSYEYPWRFVDEQQRGPFRRWWHEHTFVAMADSRTQMPDIVEYVLHLLRQCDTWLKTTLEARR